MGEADERRLVLVYAADFSLAGALRYAAERVRRRKDPCALCDITYDGLREGDAWRACRVGMPLPVEAVYRDQLTPAMAAAAVEGFPCVLAEAADGSFALRAGPAAIETCREHDAPAECLAALLAA
ncbi:MAG: hypothetical protein AAGH15_00500 [Myxococcota bacterium]